MESSNDKYVDQENKEKHVFLSMLDNLHKPKHHQIGQFEIFNYVGGFLQDHFKRPFPEVLVKLTRTEEDLVEDITGKIATEIAMSTVNDVDIHTTTLSILKILQHFGWVAKLAFTEATYILTYGDKGLNLCPNSKVFVSELPNSITSLVLREDKYKWCIELDDVDIDIDSSLKGPDVEGELIEYKIAIYRAIRVVAEIASSHLMTRSSLGYKCHTSISTGLCEKYEVIIDEYLTRTKKIIKSFEVIDVEDDNPMFTSLSYKIEGVKPETIDVNVIDHQLVVKGDRDNSLFPFERRMPLLEEYRKEKITAMFESGILTIDLPKIQNFGQKDISIPVRYL